MTAKELIEILSKIPHDTKVFINSDVGWGNLDSATYIKAFLVWHSDWNNNGHPYECYEPEPRDFVYKRGRGLPDYVVKTIGEEFILSLF